MPGQILTSMIREVEAQGQYSLFLKPLKTSQGMAASSAGGHAACTEVQDVRETLKCGQICGMKV
jgi:hypothetical protein